MDFTEAYCLVCQVEIAPKRILVPRDPIPEQAQVQTPPPPPPPPQPAPSKKSKNGARVRGGLVHGTGRVRPNGALKRTNSHHKQTSPTPFVQHPQAPKPTPTPVKMKSVIEAGPTPLYCSDECRLVDLNQSSGAYPIDYDPARQSPSIPPVPHNSFTESSSSDSSRSSSLESTSSSCTQPPSPVLPQISETRTVSPSLAILAKHYHFEPLLPLPPVVSQALASASEVRSVPPPAYDNGIIMAGRRLNSWLGKSEDSKRNVFSPRASEPVKPPAGWEQGSTAWRAAMYNLASPNASEKERERAYGTQVAFSHRPRTNNNTGTSAPARASLLRTSSAESPSVETENLYNKFNESLNRRQESRQSISSMYEYTSMNTSTSPPSSRKDRYKEYSSKILVPEVSMKPRGYSAVSLGEPSLRIRQSRSIAENHPTGEIPTPKRPVTEMRSWSYDNVRTYPVMEMPPTKEKRMEKRIVDGKEQEVEVIVEVPYQMKRLFTFAPKRPKEERRSPLAPYH